MTDRGSTPTSTLEDARAHARAQASAAEGAGLTVPSSDATDLPVGVAAADVVWDETLSGGGYASRRLPRGSVLRIMDVAGDACVQLVVFDANQPGERLNVADTVKVQWQAYLTTGALLLSSMGRALMTIVADTSGHHDCLCGGSTRLANERRYGDGSASGPNPSSRDLLCLAAAKHGLGRADVGTCINLFSRVAVADDGALHLEVAPKPGAYVELRSETAIVVLVSNTPHPLDDRAAYTVTPARCTAWAATHDDPDPFRTTPERERAFLNTDAHRRTA